MSRLPVKRASLWLVALALGLAVGLVGGFCFRFVWTVVPHGGMW